MPLKIVVFVGRARKARRNEGSPEGLHYEGCPPTADRRPPTADRRLPTYLFGTMCWTDFSFSLQMNSMIWVSRMMRWFTRTLNGAV